MMLSCKRLQRLSVPSALRGEQLVAVGESIDGRMAAVVADNGLIKWTHIHDSRNDKHVLMQLIMVSKMEAVHNTFCVMLGEAIWTLLYDIDKVVAFHVTVDFIDAHP
jgi:hypothetical protein